MFDNASRYHRLENATFSVASQDGEVRQVVYKRRRFIPSTEGFTIVAEHSVTAGERIDHIAARYHRDPTQLHLLCDANGIMHPDELTAEIGRAIFIRTPRF
jgi:hypothetical protein